jgi:hypothetical protein
VAWAEEARAWACVQGAAAAPAVAVAAAPAAAAVVARPCIPLPHILLLYFIYLLDMI